MSSEQHIEFNKDNTQGNEEANVNDIIKSLQERKNRETN